MGRFLPAASIVGLLGLLPGVGAHARGAPGRRAGQSQAEPARRGQPARRRHAPSPSSTTARSRAAASCSASWCRGAGSGARAPTMRRRSTLTTDVKVNGQTLAGRDLLGVDRAAAGRLDDHLQPARPRPGTPDIRPGRMRCASRPTPRTGSHMETLAFYFPVVDGRKAELVLHWGTVVVPLRSRCRSHGTQSDVRTGSETPLCIGAVCRSAPAEAFERCSRSWQLRRR